MVKLSTPVQYESALDELNTVRPLQLVDESKIALDIPILNSNPVGIGRLVSGKLARCNKLGSMLVELSNGFTGVERIEGTMSGVGEDKTITFSQVVSGFYIIHSVGVGGGVVRLTDPTYTIVLATLTQLVLSYFNIRSVDLHLQIVGTPDFFVTYIIEGFY